MDSAGRCFMGPALFVCPRTCRRTASVCEADKKTGNDRGCLAARIVPCLRLVYSLKIGVLDDILLGFPEDPA